MNHRLEPRSTRRFSQWAITFAALLLLSAVGVGVLGAHHWLFEKFKAIENRVAELEDKIEAPILSGIEFTEIEGQQVKVIRHALRNEGDEYWGKILQAGAAKPELYYEQYDYAVGSVREPIAFHPYQWSFNVMELLRYAKENDDYARVESLLAEKVEEGLAHAVEHEDSLYFPFPASKPLLGRTIPPNWHSAFAQAFVLRAWLELHEYTKEDRYLELAEKTYHSLAHLRKKPGQKEPWVTFVDKRGHLWFEEYVFPDDPQPRVLNGHIFVLMVLHRYNQLHPSDEARTLIQAGITTVQYYFHQFRRPGRVNLYALAKGSKPDYDPGRSILQQRWLYALTGDEFFARSSAAFATDMPFVRDNWKHLEEQARAAKTGSAEQ